MTFPQANSDIKNIVRPFSSTFQGHSHSNKYFSSKIYPPYYTYTQSRFVSVRTENLFCLFRGHPTYDRLFLVLKSLEEFKRFSKTKYVKMVCGE
jgi:hypothetical protein